MTTEPRHPAAGPSPWPSHQPGPPPPARQGGTGKWWAGIVAAFVLGGGLGAAVVQQQDAPSASRPLASTGTQAPAEPVADEPEPEPEPVTLGTDAFTVEPKVTSKQCFGSAGCSVEADLELSIMNPAARGVAASITVEVTGDESGTITETIDVDEDGQYQSTDLYMTTPSKSTKVKAKVTAVETY